MSTQGCPFKGCEKVSMVLSEDITQKEENNSSETHTQVMMGWTWSDTFRICTSPKISQAPLEIDIFNWKTFEIGTYPFEITGWRYKTVHTIFFSYCLNRKEFPGTK
jgi:hypothetical protein